MGSYWERAVDDLIYDVSADRWRPPTAFEDTRPSPPVPVPAPDKALVPYRARRNDTRLYSGPQLQSQLNLLHRASGEAQTMPQTGNKRLLDGGVTDLVGRDHPQKRVCVRKEPANDKRLEEGEISNVQGPGPERPASDRPGWRTVQGRTEKNNAGSTINQGVRSRSVQSSPSLALPREGFVDVRSMRLPASPGKVKPTSLFVYATRKGECGRLGVDTSGKCIHWIIPPKSTPPRPCKTYLIRLPGNTAAFWKRTMHNGYLDLNAPLQSWRNQKDGEPTHHGDGTYERWSFQITLVQGEQTSVKETETLKQQIEHNQTAILKLLRALIHAIDLPVPHLSTQKGQATTGGFPGTGADAVAQRSNPQPTGNAQHGGAKVPSTLPGPLGGLNSPADNVLSKLSPDYLAGYLAGRRSMGDTGSLTGPTAPAFEALAARASGVVGHRSAGQMGGLQVQQPPAAGFPVTATPSTAPGPVPPAVGGLAPAASSLVGPQSVGRLGGLPVQQLPAAGPPAMPAPGARHIGRVNEENCATS